METDIRMMLEGLRPVNEFYTSVEQTIEVLDKAIVNAMPFDGVRNEEHMAEFDDLVELREFWRGILANKKGEGQQEEPLKTLPQFEICPECHRTWNTPSGDCSRREEHR